jgi:hypothetical protein
LRPGIFALLVLAMSLVTRPLRAEAVLVVLVRPPEQSAIVSEATTRIRGELAADGFEVFDVQAPPGASPEWVLSRARQPTNAAATVALFLHADAKAAEVWVVDRLTNKTVVRTVDLATSPAGSAPEVLARRSVELLRASLLEVLVDTKEQVALRHETRAKASRWAERALEPRPPRFGVEAGALFLASFGDVGGAWMPVGRVRFGFVPRVAFRLTLSGLGTRPRVESAHGSASVGQALGLLELVGEITPPSWLTPSVSLGAGAYHVDVEGSAMWPYTGLKGETSAFAVDTGAGLALSLASSFALSFEVHATVVTPYPVIRFLDDDAAEIQNPLVSGVLTLTGRL